MAKDDKTTIEVESEVVSNIPVRVRKSRAGIFWGLLLLLWGVALILDNYLQIDIFRNFWPVVAIIFGGYLIFSSLNR